MNRTPASFALALLLAVLAQPAKADYLNIDYPGATSTVAYSYDAANQVVTGSYTDAQGHSHGYTYSVSSSTYSAPLDYPGAVSTTVYDDINRVTVGTYTDGGGQTHGFTYDYNTNTPTQIDYPGATSTTATAYDAQDRIVAGNYTDSLGHITSYTYQYGGGGGPLVQQVDPEGSTTTYTYDYNPNGTMTGSVYDAQGRTTGYIYDSNTQQTTEVRPPNDPQGKVTTYSYDTLDRRAAVSSVDTQGKVTTYIYDSVGNTYTEYDRPGATSTYIYDLQGRTAIGAYQDSSGATHAFIGPVPEPSTWAMALIGLVTLLGWGYRRRAG